MPYGPEISRMRSGAASGPCRASASAARHSYSAFAEIFIGTMIPRSPEKEWQSHFEDSKPVQLGGEPDSAVRGAASKLTAIKRVQATFRLRLTSPSTRSLILACGNRTCARPAADRCVALIVERVIRHPVSDNKGPDISPR